MRNTNALECMILDTVKMCSKYATFVKVIYIDNRTQHCAYRDLITWKLLFVMFCKYSYKFSVTYLCLPLNVVT
jgi:hypothetical protein